MAESGVLVQKRLDSDFFIIKQKSNGAGGMATYYKVKVESLIEGVNREIFHFGQMDADNDEVIIKRKASYIAGVRNDVHTAESLILSGFLGDVRYMRACCAK